MTEAKTNLEDKMKPSVCKWNEIRYLAKNNEIGYHGFSTAYDRWGAEGSAKRTEFGLELFRANVGVRPVSFAYTCMIPAQIPVIRKRFPYIRDYYWRDSVIGDNKSVTKKFRVPRVEVPAESRAYENKILVVHPSRTVLGMVKQAKNAEKDGYEYLVIIMHEIDDILIEISKVVNVIYDTCTFREIFEGRKETKTTSPIPANAGATPAASPDGGR
jgi:hypothetical protein